MAAYSCPGTGENAGLCVTGMDDDITMSGYKLMRVWFVGGVVFTLLCVVVSRKLYSKRESKGGIGK